MNSSGPNWTRTRYKYMHVFIYEDQQTSIQVIESLHHKYMDTYR